MDVGRHESGSALIMALITLLVLTLLGTTSLDNAIMEQRMARGNVDHETAFQNAELGLRSIENRLLDYSSFATLESELTGEGVYYSSLSSNYLNTSFWASVPVYANGQVLTGSDANIVDQAGLGITMIIIEYIKEVNNSLGVGSSSSSKIYYFRVTSLGTDTTYTVANANAGDRPRTLTMVQSILAVRLTP
ncbi:pilus assembly PilX family protein [Kistimonas asteriae]|uniref:pilus assembly PilX family protein n=1 Tax=Kistimonas asteriae TaxID=517724 RepID=UPI001BAC168B|nr:PilX N-terminal domain-containing pilus assembly protein [Kistimonas asteriae]